MYSFKNDYSEGAHPNILDALYKYNSTQEEGYGLDSHTENATNMIKALVCDETCDVHLIAGGTLTNLIAISAFLRPHEACISAATGHIACRETGAIEATGHKIIEVAGEDGKLAPEHIIPVLEDHHFEHMVKPKLVYISNPTESGTVYTKAELERLHAFCKEKALILYCDGARLGAALTLEGADVTMKDIYRLTDAFFIGGTKIGALMGEAIVVRNMDLIEEFRFLIKQRGALLAKGRVLGIQFEELFKNNLYFELAKYGNKMASKLAKGLQKAGCKFASESPTNQLFPIMHNEIINKLSSEFEFYVWEKWDEQHAVIRLITSWATKEEQVDKFIDFYKKINWNLTSGL